MSFSAAPHPPLHPPLPTPLPSNPSPSPHNAYTLTAAGGGAPAPPPPSTGAPSIHPPPPTPTHSPQQVAALVHILPVRKGAARVELGVVGQQLDLTRLQHVVQAQLITARQLVEQLLLAGGREEGEEGQHTAHSTHSRGQIASCSAQQVYMLRVYVT